MEMICTSLGFPPFFFEPEFVATDFGYIILFLPANSNRDLLTRFLPSFAVLPQSFLLVFFETPFFWLRRRPSKAFSSKSLFLSAVSSFAKPLSTFCGVCPEFPLINFFPGGVPFCVPNRILQCIGSGPLVIES